ncbi:efflux RND transporter periplasmic adaptor subunit [Desulfoluna spongiiphila]|uniref:RND family efflux transporter, MFP subunit n=1 Tax=Desulfoluna spongiiphila TaxID=419481 RepID=A0A1G5B0Q7_9BACT|nr:efflux RND transporter periplasmic adaptor subunit [Desulfoluna spongiiphila]SCX83732.1 RND family efflux transporter, MFP subunit [Desulfoluna spongiiphila]VVS92119.1 rnd efflux pump membrane fusion protein [Desulfoluna spongiiphila]
MEKYRCPLLTIWPLALLLLTGCGRGEAPETPPGSTPPPTHQVRAVLTPVTQTYNAVGTIRPETETVIGAQVTAQIREITVTPGTSVTKGDLLIRLDSRQLSSRFHQALETRTSAVAAKKEARQALVAAKADFDQARAAFERTQTYHREEAATDQQLEEARARYLTAEAGVSRAEQSLVAAESGIRHADEVVREAEIALGYSELKAPETGEVLKKMAEPGDLALPGKPLLVLRTSRRLILEAHVREGLIGTVNPGDTLSVKLKTLDRTVRAEVKEIVPYADPKTRTFLVRATLPMIEGLYPGMYGKLQVPLSTVEVITLPEKAIQKVGQLELVRVKTPDGWQRRYIRTGNPMGGDVEILSGLKPGETVGY